VEEASGEVGAERSEAPSSPEASGAGGGIAWNDRVLALGYTGSGKSALLDHLFDQFRVQRVLLDTKGHEFDVRHGGELVTPVRDVEAIDWAQPVIHYVDRTGEVAEFDELFAACHARRHVLVRVDEVADLCEYRPNKAPTAFRRFVSKGRAHGQGLLAATQRPVLLPAGAKTEAQHVFLFGPRLSGDDHKAMGEVIGLNAAELGEVIDALPPYGFLWYRRASRELVQCDPLPEHIRRRATTTRRTVA